MLSKVAVWSAGLLLGFAVSGSAVAMGPVGHLSTLPAQSPVEQVSFSGRPYPYGYTPWGPCIHYEPIETEWGTRWRRISVCEYGRRGRSDVVVRRLY
jgi:hypothetical protein